MYKRILGASLVAQMVKSAWDAGDPSLIPGSGRSPGEGNGNALQRSHLENSMDRGAWELQPMGVTQISAAKHIKFIIFSCKCAMCQAILPGGSPPLMTQRSGSCFLSSQQTACMVSTQAEMRKTGRLWEDYSLPLVERNTSTHVRWP